tara:strand:- start:2672 stop:3106 length:435 start_codon:yes stop_codon:yes gene_type:complete
MQRFLSSFIILLISVIFVSSSALSIAKTVSRFEKCHISKELKVKQAKEVRLRSTSCQHMSHVEKCGDCAVNCCQISVIEFSSGRVRCDNESHSKNSKCDLELVRKSGDVLDIDVKSFSILKEMDTVNEKQSRRSRFEHLDRFDI